MDNFNDLNSSSSSFDLEESSSSSSEESSSSSSSSSSIDTDIDLEIVIHCYSYQKRLSWMLSSILQQKGDLPNILISISYLPGNGIPQTEDVIKFFKGKGLNILEVPLEKGQEGNRAVPRNIRAKETLSDWILFMDCDLVFDPFFFDDLKKKLLSREFRNVKIVMGADRHSLDIPFCIKYFEEDQTIYPCIIENVAEIVEPWPKFRVGGGGIAAGYFQLVNVKAMKDKGGIYSGRKRDHWRMTKSDRQFRCHMGGRMPIPVKKMYHLNHDRGSPEIQR